MTSCVQYTGRWVTIQAFMDASGYIPVVGPVPHVRVDNSGGEPRLKVWCSDGQIREVRNGQYLVLEDEQDPPLPSRYNASTQSVGTVWTMP